MELIMELVFEPLTPEQLAEARRYEAERMAAEDEWAASGPRWRKRDLLRRRNGGACTVKGCTLPCRQFASGQYDVRCGIHKDMHEFRTRSKQTLARLDMQLAELGARAAARRESA